VLTLAAQAAAVGRLIDRGVEVAAVGWMRMPTLDKLVGAAEGAVPDGDAMAGLGVNLSSHAR
jgi:hypothetical protein